MGVTMLQAAVLTATAVIEVLAITAWIAYTAGYRAGPRQQGLTEKPLALPLPRDAAGVKGSDNTRRASSHR
jgi:hypothetical protein